MAKQKSIGDFFKLKEANAEVRKDNGSEGKSRDLCTAIQPGNDNLTKAKTKESGKLPYPDIGALEIHILDDTTKADILRHDDALWARHYAFPTK